MARRTGSTMIDLGPRLWLAAFGKHPGWNDHVDDLGVETDRLVAVKRAIYTEGIAGVIDSGGWEKLEGDQRSDGFDHSFVWRHHEGFVVGRMWSSSDGKGRQKYPMILVAQVDGAPLRFVTERVFPRVKQLEDECRAAESAATVISLVDAARAELRQAAERAGRVLSDALPPPAAVSQLSEREALGPGREGLERVMYQLERDFASYRRPSRGESGTRSKTMDTRPQQLRVPRVAGSIGEEWSLWLRLLVSELDPLSPVLCLTNESRSWTDIVVGEPGSAQFHCLQASESAWPLTTSIPYTIDDAFRQRVSERIESGRGGEVVEHDPAYVSIGSERLAQLARGVVSGKPGASGGSGGGIPKPVLIAGIAGLLVLGGVLAALAFLGGGGGGEEAPEEPALEEETASLDGASFTASELRAVEGLERWCEAADAWVLVFAARASDIDPMGDAHVVALLERVERGLGGNDGAGIKGFDPVETLDVEMASSDPRVELAESVRSGERARLVSKASARETIAKALTAISDLEAMLTSDAWASAANAESLAESLGKAGAADASEMIASTLEDLETGNGRSRAEAVEAIVSSSGDVERLASDLATIGEAVRVVEASGAAASGLGGFKVFAETGVSDAAGAVTGLGRVGFASDRLAPLTGVSSDIAAFFERDWESVDREVFAEDPAWSVPVRDAMSARAWIAAAGDPRFVEVDPADDPRLGKDVGDRLADLTGRLGAVSGEWTGDEETLTRVRSLLDRAEAASDEWRAVSSMAWKNRTRGEVERRTGAVVADELLIRAEADTLVASLAGSIEEYFERLGPTISRRGLEPIDTEWVARRDELASRIERDDPVALRVSIDGVRDALLALELRLDGKRPPEWDWIDAAAAEAAIDGWAARGVRESIEVMAWNGSEYATTEGPDLDRIETAFRNNAQALLVYIDVGMESELLNAYGDSLGPGNDSGFVHWVNKVRETEFYADPLVPPVFANAIGFVEYVEAVSKMGIDDAIRATRTGDLSRRLAAWRRVSEIGAKDGITVDRLEALAPSVVRLSQEQTGKIDVLDRAQRLWVSAALAATARDELQRVAFARESFGVTDDGLAQFPALAFDLALLAFQRAAEVAEREGAPVVSLEEVWARISAASSAADLEASVLADVLGAMAPDNNGAAPRLDPSEVGPGRGGFEGTWLDGTRIAYRSPSGVELRFALVEPDGADPVMVCEHEAPVGLLTEHVWVSEKAKAIVERYLDGSREPLEDLEGVRTWVWSGPDGEPVLAEGWIRAKALEESSISGPGDAPTVMSPLTGVSRLGATAIAAAVGCRLPTEAEWRAAFEASGSPEVGPATNVRDASFAARRDGLDRGNLGTDWPTRGVFASRGEDDPLGPDAPSLAFDDGAVWFYPVSGARSDETSFEHVIGNVAEFVGVYEGSGEAARGDVDGPPSDGGPDLRALVREGGLRVAVIGGSALSAPPPVASVDRPRVMSSRIIRGGYTDVGLRLAFGLGGRAVERSAVSRARVAAESVAFLTIESDG
ncbi:MAG: SUMF1/EgtB/PvdO family nonheme iron enzyme [Planctomycetota bacterium]